MTEIDKTVDLSNLLLILYICESPLTTIERDRCHPRRHMDHPVTDRPRRADDVPPRRCRIDWLARRTRKCQKSSAKRNSDGLRRFYRQHHPAYYQATWSILTENKHIPGIYGTQKTETARVNYTWKNKKIKIYSLLNIPQRHHINSSPCICISADIYYIKMPFTFYLTCVGPGKSPFPHLLLDLEVSCSIFYFSFFTVLLALSIFLLFHSFPFYQNSPTQLTGEDLRRYYWHT